MKVKVCGMKIPGNVEAIASLNLDYMGFIFHPASSRYVGKDFHPENLNLLAPETKATGVFVDEPLASLLEKIDLYHFDAVQLHGNESPEYCRAVLQGAPGVEVIKAFALNHSFDFSRLARYQECCTRFLFDAAGAQPGGNGAPFDWELLAKYDGCVPFFLSGGIAPEATAALQELSSRYPLLDGIDLNSRFETAPGEKDTTMIATFLDRLKQ